MSQTTQARIAALLKTIQDYDVPYALAKKDQKKAVTQGAYHKMDEVFDDFRIERSISYLPAKKELRNLGKLSLLEAAILGDPKKALRELFREDMFVVAVRNLEAEGRITVEREHGFAREVAKDQQLIPFSERYPNTLITQSTFTENTPSHGYMGAICPQCTIRLNRSLA